MALALVGAGGKTTALFQLARELPPPVITTTTTHLHQSQIRLADSHWIGQGLDVPDLERRLNGVMLITGPLEGDRATGIDESLLSELHQVCRLHHLPMLLEADGSRLRPLKAPGSHEPVIPGLVDTVVVVAGLQGLGKPLSSEFVHRPEVFSSLSGLKMGDPITPAALARVLAHPAGGLKNIPRQARRVALLNQADSPELQAQAKMLAESLLPAFHSVVIVSLRQSRVHAVHESIAAIILAAGGSSRFGKPKQLLHWRGRPFIYAVAETSLQAGLSPVVVVTGADAGLVETALKDLQVIIARNEDWQSGQASSIRAGLQALLQILKKDSLGRHEDTGNAPQRVGAVAFLLADQPQITSTILHALREEHARTLAPVIAPLVGGQRANPVLLDRVTFADLMTLSGDAGGRAIFNKYPPNYIPWNDESLLLDVDTPADYLKLMAGG
jgi:molybdenum cofactor cytidylyltransferase